MTRYLLLPFLSLLLALLSCQPSTKKAEALIPTRTTIIDSLKHPWSMAFLSEDEVIVSEKDGNLLRVNLSTKERYAISGFPEDLVDSIRVKDGRDNSGIFEVVLHPDFQENQQIYVSYAAEAEGGSTTKVVRVRLENDSLKEIAVILVAQPYSRDLFHYGGGMTFGSDGKLYVTVGERYYNEIDQPDLPVAQDIQDRRGKVYRLNSNGSIPVDNPDMGVEAIPGMYAMGIRAAQGITLHPETGDIWFSEHGSFQGDEVNLLRAGANYGWPIKTTGKYRNDDFQPPAIDATFTEPAWSWEETVAPTGLCFYTGDEFSEWKGQLLVPGLSKGNLWLMKVEAQKITFAEKLFPEKPLRLRKVAQSPEGKIYLLTDEPQGRILRLLPE